MQTVMTTNNGYDCILLVDDDDQVLSAWMVDKDTMTDYLRDGAQADKWDTGQWYMVAECQRIADYGEECGRDGVIDSEARREFWRNDTITYQITRATGEPARVASTWSEAVKIAKSWLGRDELHQGATDYVIDWTDKDGSKKHGYATDFWTAPENADREMSVPADVVITEMAPL